jgi:hypothetical protein
VTGFCPQCGNARSGNLRYCAHCGYDFGASSLQPAQPTVPLPVQPPQPVPTGDGWVQPKRADGPLKTGITIVLLGGLAALGFYGCIRGGDDSTTPAARTPEPATKHLVGTFLRWEPVDDSRGYAYFKITNNGSTTETAKCTIKVENDFGNFGFDYLVGESVPAGDTIRGRIALDVGEGSFLIDRGEVTDC